MPILIFPLFGGAFYIIYRRQNFSPKIIKHYKTIDQQRMTYVQGLENPLHNKASKYLNRLNWPVYGNTETTFSILR